MDDTPMIDKLATADARRASISDRALLDVTAAAIPRLRKSEQKVAEVVLARPNDVVGASMAAFAEMAGVSEPTIMRFCLAIGCEGFVAFKLRLAKSLAFGVRATHSVITPEDGTDALMEKIFDYTITSLDHARYVLDRAAVAKAIDALSSSGEILFFGLGASGIIAQDAQQKFPLFRAPCSAPVDAHQQFMAASLAGPGTTVVAISNTGRTSSVVSAAELASSNGATVIGMAGSASPLLEISDIRLVVETLENTDFYTPTISRIAGLIVVDILATGVALRHDASYIDRVRRMKAQLSAMREGSGDASLTDDTDGAKGEETA